MTRTSYGNSNTQQYTTTEDLEYKPRPSNHHMQERTYALGRPDPRGNSILHHSSRTSSNNAQGGSSGSAGGTPRRRIPVACVRCRKRKIRCSGEPGNGQGCDNCKNASLGLACQFLRVSSSNVDFPSPLEANRNREFSYCSTTASVSAPSLSLGNDHGNYHHSLRTSQSSSTLGPTYHQGHTMMSMKGVYQPEAYHHSSGSDNGSNILLGPTNNFHLTRNSLLDGMSNDLNAGGEMGGSNGGGGALDSYDGNCPQYMLPDIGQGLATAHMLQPEFLRHWTPLTSNGTRAHSSLYLDHDTSSSNGQVVSSYTLGGHSHSRTMDNYNPPIFPALSNLSETLPSPAISSSNGYASRPLDKVILPNLFPARTQIVEHGLHSRSIVNDTSGSSGYSSTSAQSPIVSSGYKNYNNWSETTISPTPAISYSPLKTSHLNSSSSPYLSGIPVTSIPHQSQSAPSTSQSASDSLSITSSYLHLSSPYSQAPAITGSPILRDQLQRGIGTKQEMGAEAPAKAKPVARQNVTQSSYCPSPTTYPTRTLSSGSVRSIDSQPKDMGSHSTQQRRVMSKVY